MRKKYIIASATIAGLLLVSGGAYAYMNSTTPNDTVVVDETVTVKTITPIITNTPSATPTPVTPPVEVETPATTNNFPSQNQSDPADILALPEESAPAQEPAPISDTWTDEYGNTYSGNNAIACADGSAPTTIGYGMPTRCAFSGTAILVE